MSIIGRRIRDLRKRSPMTQTELGSILGVRFNTISQWETGRNEPDAAILTKIAELFDVTLDWLMGRTDELPWDPGGTAPARWPNLSPERRQKAAWIVNTPGVAAYLRDDISDDEFDILWSALEIAIKAGLAAADVGQKSEEKPDQTAS